MEVTLSSGDKLNIPDGYKAVIDGGVITIEKYSIVDDLKNGDFICYSYREMGSDCCLGIFEGIYKLGKMMLCHVAFNPNECVKVDNGIASVPKRLRFATEKEKQWLLDKLHAVGKDWDAENKRIIEYKWKPEIGDTFYFIDRFLEVLDISWDEDSADDLAYSRGNCFKTKEEAQKYADKFSEILKERKL